MWTAAEEGFVPSERSVTGRVHNAYEARTDETHLNLLTNLTQWSVLTLFTRFRAAGLLRAFRYRCDGTYCSKNNGLSRADVLGCLSFCGLDKNRDGEVSEEEMADGLVLECSGGNPG